MVLKKLTEKIATELVERSGKRAKADRENLLRIFTIPEGQRSTLSRIEQKISKDINGFLSKHIIATDRVPHKLEQDFMDCEVPAEPMFVSEQAEYLLSKVVSHSVHTSSPYYIGHMTAPLPYFMLPLAKIMIALNQNLVKIETSKAFTPLERQVLGMLHHLFYERKKSFYQRHAQSPESSLGVMTSGGTIANITALWVAINRLLPANAKFGGIKHEGLIAACRHYGYDDLAILVSGRGHYSFKKACHLLGIGLNGLVTVATDEYHRLDVTDLKRQIAALKKRRVGIIAVIGIAGTTETGTIDPLAAMAEVCDEEQIHFHVDGAWGAPAIFSEEAAKALTGIDKADSIVVDGHKQLYVPMGCGMVLFKDPAAMAAVEHSAKYVVRKGSRDLGRRSLEGSRPGMALLIHSGLRILGRKGYGLLIEDGLSKAKRFAALIRQRPEFELTSEPELNILTYRYLPASYREALKKPLLADHSQEINERINQLTVTIQKRQRDKGQSFVSRTTLPLKRYFDQDIVVFRVVLANPLTTEQHLREILDQQVQLAAELRPWFSRLPRPAFSRTKS